MRNSVVRKLLVAAIALNAVLFWLWRRSGRPHAFEAIPEPTPSPASPSAQPAAALQRGEPDPAAASVRRLEAEAAPRRTSLRLLLAGALALALVGQLYFAEGQLSPSLSTGLALYLAAILLFALAATRADRPAGASSQARHAAYGHTIARVHYRFEARLGRAIDSALGQVAEAIRPLLLRPRRMAALLLVALLTVVLLDLLRVDPPLPDYTLPFVVWLSAIGLYVRTVVPRQPRSPTRGTPWWKSDWRIAATLAGIVLAAFALRVWDLEGTPSTLAGDEGTFGLESIKTITGEIRNPFTTGWLSVPTMSFYFNSLTIRLFGQTVFALRLPWALVGTVTVLIVFQLVRRLAGLTLALMTAALLATYHFHIHYSRLGINNATDPFLIALVLLLLHRAIDRRSRLDWALCGIVVGVAQYFYFGARFAVILVGVMVTYSLVRGGMRFLREHGQGVAIMVGALIVAGAPMIQYAIRFPLDYNARINQIGIIQSGWLEREQVIRSQGAWPILLDQLQRAVLAFNVYPDRFGFYNPPGPLFDYLTGVLFLLGLGYATLRPGDSRLFPWVVWWWGGTILGGALTVDPPSTHRLVTLGPPAVFFVALAWLKIGQIAQRAWNAWAPQRLIPFLAAAVLAISIASVNWYFVEFTPLRVYGTFNAIVATEMATYMRDRLGPDWRVYFFGPPRIYVEFGSIPYIAPEVEGVNIVEPLAAPSDPSLAPPDKHAAFIFLPERRAELDWVRQTFPDGTVEEIPSPRKGDQDPLFIVYRVQMGPSQSSQHDPDEASRSGCPEFLCARTRG